MDRDLTYVLDIVWRTVVGEFPKILAILETLLNG